MSTGLAAVHQAIAGDRLRLALDQHLFSRVSSEQRALAHPGLVWDLAIGHSTVVTGRVVANLFYRGLQFHRLPLIGDTLATRTEVVALRANRARTGRPPTGMAVLRITTRDEHERLVLDFWRCAMLPVRDPERTTAVADDLDGIGAHFGPATAAELVRGWDLAEYRRACGGGEPPPAGVVVAVRGGDVVSAAPELARLTLNIAGVHHDAEAAGGRRLVYGGHTIGLAASQLLRALPDIVTIVGWHGCNHTGPVYEGDTVESRIEVQRSESLPVGTLLHLRCTVDATSTGTQRRAVLDWRPIVIMA